MSSAATAKSAPPTEGIWFPRAAEAATWEARYRWTDASFVHGPRSATGAFRRPGTPALALVLAASSVAFVLAGDHTSWGHPLPLAVALALVTSIPVASRSRQPLLAVALVLAGNGACAYVAAPHQAAFQPFVARALVAYSVGSRYEGTTGAPAALAIAAVPLFVVAVVQGRAPANAIPNYVWLLAAWTVGQHRAQLAPEVTCARAREPGARRTTGAAGAGRGHDRARADRARTA